MHEAASGRTSTRWHGPFSYQELLTPNPSHAIVLLADETRGTASGPLRSIEAPVMDFQAKRICFIRINRTVLPARFVAAQPGKKALPAQFGSVARQAPPSWITRRRGRFDERWPSPHHDPDAVRRRRPSKAGP